MTLMRVAPVALALLAVAVAALVFATQSRDVLGLFHDDGVYVVAAKSLAERGTYVIESLPGEPAQTKYPPVYSVLLALVWRAVPSFPDNISLLKAVNVVLVAITLFGFGWLARQSLPREPLVTTLVLILMLGTTPGVVTFADYAMSDILFLAIALWCLVASDWTAGPVSRRRHVALAALIAVAILSRSVGVCLVAAAVLDQLIRGNRGWATFHGVVGIATFAGWYVWAAGAAGPADPIISYYQLYETSAIGYLRSDPALAVGIVLGNVRLLVDGARLVIGPSFGLWPALLGLAVPGAATLWRAGHRFPFLFATVYGGVVLVHPFAPHRYLLPLLPIFYLSVLHGARTVADWAEGRPRRVSAVPTVVVLATAALMLVGNVTWVRHVLSPVPEGHMRGWYGADFGYSWEGFEETFDWIRENTTPADRLGTVYDPMYYLYTGRQAVRPWFHHPETYFYPPDAPDAFVGRPIAVARQLRTLGVSYLVLDPPTGYAEGEAATKLLREILILDDVNASHVFTSRDGKHEVHRLDWSTLDRAR